MDQPIIPYADWPKWVEIATVISTKALTIKNPKTARWLTSVSFVVGFLALALPFYLDYKYDSHPPGQEIMEIILFTGGFLNLLIGVLNLIFTSKAVEWIRDNSNWEERFSNKASTENKLTMFAILVGIGIISYLLALVFQSVFR